MHDTTARGGRLKDPKDVCAWRYSDIYLLFWLLSAIDQRPFHCTETTLMVDLLTNLLRATDISDVFVMTLH